MTEMDRVLIVDGSYMLHRALKTPDLWELTNKDGVRTGGVFGFLRMLGYSVKQFDYYPVLCWDSGLSPRRLEIYPNYKRHLEKSKINEINRIAKKIVCKEIEDVPETVSQEDRVRIEEAVSRMLGQYQLSGKYEDPDDYMKEYIRQRDTVISICVSMGIPSLGFSGWEGDDIITLASRTFQKSIIVSDDKDMIQLLAPNISIFRAMRKEFLEHDSYIKECDAYSSRDFVIQKAIIGDPSDNIPSITYNELSIKYKIGDVNAKKIAKVISRNHEDEKAYIAELESRPEGLPSRKIEGFIRNHTAFMKNMSLVDLSLVDNDRNIINQIITELDMKAGKINFFEANSKIGLQGITDFDLQGFIARIKQIENTMK